MANTTRLLVLYHSSYGHVETLAYAVAHGARAVDGVQVSIKRVPELMPEEIMLSAGMKVEQPAPVADPQELANYDAIIFGTPTRFGNMSSQMRNFLDQTGPLWVEGALIGKVGSVFTSTSTGGGNETTIVSLPLDAAASRHDRGRPPLLGAGSRRRQRGEGRLALRRRHHRGADGSRLPSQKELNLASFQGHHVAEDRQAPRHQSVSRITSAALIGARSKISASRVRVPASVSSGTSRGANMPASAISLRLR